MNYETSLILQTLHTQSSKWILDLNVKPKATKLLGENVRKNLYGFP